MRGPYRKRRIDLPPNFQSFKPGGVPRKLLTTIILAVDEYEAVRLADYEGMEHLQAAGQMGISRPTFTRLIEKARNKIARALVDGMELIVEGGNVEFKNTRRRCGRCGDEEVVPFKRKPAGCPRCGSDIFEDSAQNFIPDPKGHKKKNRGESK